jgi:acetoin utilization protein AcuB
MKITEIMTKKVHTISPEKTLLECADAMDARKLNGLVVTENGKVAGVITKADIFRSILPSYADIMEDAVEMTRLEFIEERINRLNDVHVKSVMTTPPITIESDFPVVKAGSLMIARRVKQLPVVDGDRLVGIVTLTDVVNYLRKKVQK